MRNSLTEQREWIVEKHNWELEKQTAMNPTEENNHQDLVDQTFEDKPNDGYMYFARFILTFIVISILGAGILILLIVFNA